VLKLRGGLRENSLELMAEWSRQLNAEDIDSLYRYIYHAFVIPIALGQLLIALEWHGVVSPYSWLVGLFIGGGLGIFLHFERKWGYPLESLLTDNDLNRYVRAAFVLILAPSIVIGAWYAGSLGVGKDLISVFITAATTLTIVGIFEFAFVPVDLG